jgi:hypothetical protein
MARQNVWDGLYDLKRLIPNGLIRGFVNTIRLRLGETL